MTWLVRAYQTWEAYQLAIFSMGVAGLIGIGGLALMSSVRQLEIGWQIFFFVALFMVIWPIFGVASPIARELRHRAFARLGITAGPDEYLRLELPDGPIVAGSDFEVITAVKAPPQQGGEALHFTAVQGRRVIVKRKEAKFSDDRQFANLVFTSSETARCRSGEILIQIEVTFPDGRRQIQRPWLVPVRPPIA